MEIALGELTVEYGGIIDVDDKRLFSVMANGSNHAGLRILSIPHILNPVVLEEFCAEDRKGQKYRAKIILERVEE